MVLCLLSEARIVQSLWWLATGWTTRVQSLEATAIFPFPMNPDWARDLLSLYSVYTAYFFPGESEWNFTSTPPYAFIAWLPWVTLPVPCSYIYMAASPCCCRVILFLHLLSCILINKIHSLVKEHKSAIWWEDEILTQSKCELQNILETVLVNRRLSTGITLLIHTVCVSRPSAVSVTWLFSSIG
jgi:hypothetical protein